MVTDLLIITPGFPAHEGDSTCIPPLQVYLLALRKSRPELRIAVITTQYPYTDRPYTWHGIEVHPCNGRIHWYWKWRTWRRAVSAFRDIRERGAVRVVHSLWLGETAMLGVRFAKQDGARHVLTLMGQDARDATRWWKQLRTKPTTVCLTDRHATFFRRMSGAPPNAVISWGIGMEDLERSSGSRTIDLLWCGSFLPVKDPLGFISVLNELRVKRKVRAVMIGKGGKVFHGTHYKVIGDLLGEESLAIVDTLARPEVLKVMSQAKILVHTSSYESQGFVFDEALARGMLISSYAVGSADHSTRWRCDARSSIGLANDIIDLLDHPPSTEPLILHPVEATVNEYLRLYGLL